MIIIININDNITNINKCNCQIVTKISNRKNRSLSVTEKISHRIGHRFGHRIGHKIDHRFGHRFGQKLGHK